jgi:hypothetical protein
MKPLKFICSLSSALLVVAFLGCASPVGSEPTWERQVGAIEIGGDQAPPIELPETVERGVPFASTVVTFGSSVCVRADGAEVDMSGLTAHITPYDLVAVTGVCTDDLAPYAREVTLQFDEVGEATVRVLGLTLFGEPAQYEARVLVLPGGDGAARAPGGVTARS